MRLLLAGLLTLAAFTALTPNASAVYICGHQNDASDLVIGDDPVWRTHCTTENVINYDCEATVTVTTTGITYPAGCEPILCNPCCGYCPPPMESTSAQAQLPCAIEVVDTDGYIFQCPSFLYCVTEPCPGSGPIRVAWPALPCGTVGSPVLDGGFGVVCSTPVTECHAVVATFGTLEDFLSPSVGCSKPSLEPPYDCLQSVQDCDGPPVE